MRQDECSQRMRSPLLHSGVKKKGIKFIFFDKVEKIIFSRNVARLGMKGRTDIRNPVRLCSTRYLERFLNEFCMWNDTKYSDG